MSDLRIWSHVYHFSAFRSNNPCADTEEALWAAMGQRREEADWFFGCLWALWTDDKTLEVTYLWKDYHGKSQTLESKKEKSDLRQVWGKYYLNETMKKKVKSKVHSNDVKY